LLSPSDLPAYTDLSSASLVLRAALPLSRALWPALIQALLQIWADVAVLKSETGKQTKTHVHVVLCSVLLSILSLLF
jgi:hypothetical protein